MSIEPGNYVGKIVEHGTDTSQSGLPFVWFDVKVQGQTVKSRVYLEGKTPEKTETAIRMARQILRLCGFDPDQRQLSDLDDVPTLLAGNEVPIRVTEREYQGKFYPNYDIALPSGVSKKQAESLTDRLRAAKHKDEEPMTASAAPAATTKPAAAGSRFNADAPDDIPF